jgi:hypothetical protein
MTAEIEKSGLRICIALMQIRLHFFTLMLIWILLPIKVIQICDRWSAEVSLFQNFGKTVW